MELFHLATSRQDLIDWAKDEERGGCDPLPLFDPTGHFQTRLQSWQGGWELPTERLRTNPRKLLVSVRSSRYADLAPYAARASGAVLLEVDSLDELPQRLSKRQPDFVLLLLEPAQISHDFYAFYQQEILSRCAAGLLVARTEAHLSWLLLKSRLQSRPQGHLTMLPRSRKREPGQEHWKVLTRAHDMYGEAQERMRGQALETIAFSTHGTEDVIMLADAVVCGKSTLGQPEGLTCEFAAGCNFGEQGFLAADIQSRIVLANTCMGVRLHDTFLPLEASTALTFLENHAAAYVSSYMVKYGPDAELCLLQNLVAHGYAVGSATRLVNRWLEKTGFDFPSFVVLGDPSVCVAQPSTSAAPTIRWTAEDRAEISACGRTLVEIEVPEDVFVRYPYVSVKGRQDIFFARIEADGEQPCRLLLFAWAPLAEDVLTLELKTGEEVEFARGRLSANSWLLGLQRHAAGKRLHPEAPSILAHLDRIGRHMLGLDFDAGSYRQVVLELQKLRSAVDTIQNKTVRQLLDRAASVNTIWMPDSYLETARIVRQLPTNSPCWICSSRLRQVRFEHPVTRDAREVLYCPRCGGIADSPEEAVLQIEVKGPDRIGYEERLEQQLVITNRSASRVAGVGGLRIESTAYYGLPTDPELVPFELQPWETRAFPISWQMAPDMVPQLYYIKGIVMSDFDLYYTNKPLFIRAI